MLMFATLLKIDILGCPQKFRTSKYLEIGLVEFNFLIVS